MSARVVSGGARAALLALALATAGAGGRPVESKDPLAAESERWSAYLRGNTATDETWTQVKEVSEPALKRTEEALRDDRRLLALQRLAAVRVNLAASAYLGQRPPEQLKDTAAFEAEWARLGKVLRDDLGAPSPGALDGVQPAAVRALGEAALPQVRTYYEASLEFGRNTMPDSGLFYLGAAQAQREFAAFGRSFSAPSPRRAPPLRVLHAESDVRKLATELKLPLVFTMGTPDLVRALGDVSAVPTLFMFDGDGRTAAAFYGAPPTLHADAEARLASLLK